ncbi:hypothetical protein VULLAG_LOCUS7149 [Vulpes lagopus]
MSAFTLLHRRGVEANLATKHSCEARNRPFPVLSRAIRRPPSLTAAAAGCNQPQAEDPRRGPTLASSIQSAAGRAEREKSQKKNSLKLWGTKSHLGGNGAS